MVMEQKYFHGNFTPEDLAQCLLVHFNRGNLVVNKLGSEEKVAVQIQTRQSRTSGGETALGITFQSVEDGVAVQVGQQAWLGIAASLGYSALSAIRNPFNLLHRIDDIAQDFEYMQLTDEVWKVLTANARALGSGYELSKRLSRITCDYCRTANPTGASNCIACGAPMGDLQPKACKNCGYILLSSDEFCPNCKMKL